MSKGRTHHLMDPVRTVNDLMVNIAMHNQTGEHIYVTDVGKLHGFICDWKWTPEGDMVRRITGNFWLTSKTRKFQLTFFAQATIERKEIDGNTVRAIRQLMEDKTSNMESSYVFHLEQSVGKGKSFPAESRNRFTILRIENVNDEG